LLVVTEVREPLWSSVAFRGSLFFFFNGTPPTDIYTLSLHDALPICLEERRSQAERALGYVELYGTYAETEAVFRVERLLQLWERSEEHTSELQSRGHLVCRLLLEKKKANAAAVTE